MNGWIKLHRKILQNDALFRSPHTFPVWCWLLLTADYHTGIVTCGRFQISRCLKIKPTTVYLALKRLQNMTTIKMKPDNKMTTIYILNWNLYQSKHDNNMTTKRQQNDTNKEVKKNKENTLGGDFEKLITQFNIFFGKSYKSTPGRLIKYKARRKNYSSEQINIALVNLSNWDFAKKNDRGWVPDPDYLLRNDEQIDKFINMSSKKSVWPTLEEVKEKYDRPRSV